MRVATETSPAPDIAPRTAPVLGPGSDFEQKSSASESSIPSQGRPSSPRRRPAREAEVSVQATSELHISLIISGKPTNVLRTQHARRGRFLPAAVIRRAAGRLASRYLPRILIQTRRLSPPLSPLPPPLFLRVYRATSPHGTRRCPGRCGTRTKTGPGSRPPSRTGTKGTTRRVWGKSRAAPRTRKTCSTPPGRPSTAPRGPHGTLTTCSSIRRRWPMPCCRCRHRRWPRQSLRSHPSLMEYRLMVY